MRMSAAGRTRRRLSAAGTVMSIAVDQAKPKESYIEMLFSACQV